MLGMIREIAVRGENDTWKEWIRPHMALGEGH